MWELFVLLFESIAFEGIRAMDVLRYPSHPFQGILDMLWPIFLTLIIVGVILTIMPLVYILPKGCGNCSC
ncbi:MAG: hypothetical protein ACXABG_00020 [Promethearchaeota archaeon]